jgi:hypothetical protein
LRPTNKPRPFQRLPEHKIRGKRRCLCLILPAFVFMLSAALVRGGEQTEKKTGDPDSPYLTDEDKAQLTAALRLKETFGDIVWPGFAEAKIPLILYNGKYEFLTGHPDPPAPWVPVPDDQFRDKPYYRREVDHPQAFAIQVGNLWAGSLDSLSHMNRTMEDELRRRRQDNKITPAVLRMFLLTPAQHAAAILHEAFHAFQATVAPKRFLDAGSVYEREHLYPFQDEALVKSWNHEGALLASAARAKDRAEKRMRIREFLENRALRRKAAVLSAPLRDFERELEWLEGLAKYAEMRFMALASEGPDPAAKDYRVALNRSRWDFASRLLRLGELSGDLRFYLSGAAQAFLLDDIFPSWKDRLNKDSGAFLEDLLSEALEMKITPLEVHK